MREKLIAFHKNKISLESMFRWLFEDTVKFEIDVGVCKNSAKI